MTKVVSIAVAAGVLGASLTIAPVDADPVNGWGGVRGAWHPNSPSWHPNREAWRRGQWAHIFFFGSPLDYWPPYGDYWPPYAGSDSVGSIQRKKAFCY
jgi:hypothetical protein